ncbi:uncharacterized protein YjbJ (UPF0337 family) [Staphylococcus saprophyticus]|jgi:uncharacterized protein YjbJ (UPF0337 family)|nr:MF3-like protein [Streptococcus equi subsp. equi]SUM62618.1 CsbD-like protein [Staphylococcus saprophyticus]SUM85344.1 CsbD-like protein [Staphylococcus saprophyticus]
MCKPSFLIVYISMLVKNKNFLFVCLISLLSGMYIIYRKEVIIMADENKFEQAKGNVKETVGNVTDNKELENEGKEDKTSGKAKEFVENAKDKANEVIDKFKK